MNEIKETQQQAINFEQKETPKEVQQVVAEAKVLEQTRENLPTTQVGTQVPTIWNDSEMLEKAWKSAKFLASTDIVPQTFKKPENCLIALDIANRTGMQPLTVMQNLYVVQGRPSWSGQMCIALVNGCGRFSPLEFTFVGERGTDDFGCYAHATRLDNGKEYASDIITRGLAKREGWYNKNGSKWQSMEIQMMMYRAGAFFARVHCPDVLMGLPLADEMRDVYGYGADTRQDSGLTSLLDEEIKKEKK